MSTRDTLPSRRWQAARDCVRRCAGDRRGNVAIVFAFALIPIIFLAGMAFDFTRAAQKQVLLNAAADAAALAAVTPTMLAQSDAKAISTAQNIFNAQASTVPALSYNAKNLSVAVTDQGLTRTVTVSYAAASDNIFSGILNRMTWPINGTSTATATVSPDIDFYLLLDNSPSMNIAATQAGINLMVANTQGQKDPMTGVRGCAFACHESYPAGENPPLGNPGGEDNYKLAQNLGVVTRIENMVTAVQLLTTAASQAETSNKASYRMAIYTFNNSGTSTVQTLTSSMRTAYTAASGIDVLEVYTQGYLTQSSNNDDQDTDFNSAMSNINSAMPAPGNGTPTGTPQEVLFIVSDGVDDKNSTTCSQPLVPNTSRCQQPFDTTWCTTVKSRGIRIAVLYTEYLPLPGNNWYNSWISPFQSQIATNLQSCASPGLYTSITTDGDISAALQGLFNLAISTAHLTH